MTLEQINQERRMLEGQVELAVQQFKQRCGLQDWQITVNWGVVKVTSTLGANAPGYEMYTATVSVRV